MAKGEQRSNREKKKPKKEKIKTIAAAPSRKGAAGGLAAQLGFGQDEVGKRAVPSFKPARLSRNPVKDENTRLSGSWPTPCWTMRP